MKDFRAWFFHKFSICKAFQIQGDSIISKNGNVAAVMQLHNKAIEADIYHTPSRALANASGKGEQLGLLGEEITMGLRLARLGVRADEGT
jgi:hypothetical protein